LSLFRKARKNRWPNKANIGPSGDNLPDFSASSGQIPATSKGVSVNPWLTINKRIDLLFPENEQTNPISPSLYRSYFAFSDRLQPMQLPRHTRSAKSGSSVRQVISIIDVTIRLRMNKTLATGIWNFYNAILL